MFSLQNPRTWVKQVIVLVLMTVWVWSVGGCMTQADRDREQADNARRKEESLKGIVNNIFYIKDPQTGLCFAYYWGGMANGGPALTVVPCEAIPAEKLIVANGPAGASKKDSTLATVASAAQVAEVDTTDVMAVLEHDVLSGVARFDSLLALDSARPFPKDQDYIERSIYDQCADALLTTTRVLEHTVFQSPEHQRAAAVLAMREWQPRFMEFRHFRTGFGMSGMDEGKDWMSLCQMGYQYIAVLEPAFKDANAIASHIDAGSE